MSVYRRVTLYRERRGVGPVLEEHRLFSGGQWCVVQRRDRIVASGSGRDGHDVGQLADRPVAEHGGVVEVGAELGVDRRDDLERRERCAAEIEEVVGHAHRLEPEDLGPDLAQSRLDRSWLGSTRRSPRRCNRVGAGRAATSAFALAASGTSSMRTKALGTACSGSRARRCVRSSSGLGSAPSRAWYQAVSTSFVLGW